MSCSNGQCAVTAFTPEQRAAASPWVIALLVGKLAQFPLFAICCILGWFIPGQAAFRTAVAVCATWFVAEEVLFGLCSRNLRQIEGNELQVSGLGWIRPVLVLLGKGFFAYLAFEFFVFTHSV